MIVALVDNGSLEPAAHRNLRTAAAELTVRSGTMLHAVSWKHSNRIAPPALDGVRAWTLGPFVRAMWALGQREFVFVPFFISPQGAIGSALQLDLEKIGRELAGCEFRFSDGLAARGVIPSIVASRIRETIALNRLQRPPVIVVDHGGPSPASAALRDRLAAEIRSALAGEIGPLVAASMEGADYVHNLPLLADQLNERGFDRGHVVIAPLFLAPGRHAGPTGDLAQIATTASESSIGAETRLAAPARKCHFTGLVGDHPLAIAALAEALRDSLSPLHAQPFA